MESWFNETCLVLEYVCFDTKNGGIVVRFKEMGRTLTTNEKEAHGFRENRLLLSVSFKCLSLALDGTKLID